jgi:hypothetical protein
MTLEEISEAFTELLSQINMDLMDQTMLGQF